GVQTCALPIFRGFGAGRVPALAGGQGRSRRFRDGKTYRIGHRAESWRHHVRKGELAPSFPERRDRSHLLRKGKAGPIISGNERPVPSFPDRKRSGGRSWTGKGQSIGARGKAG